MMHKRAWGQRAGFITPWALVAGVTREFTTVGLPSVAEKALPYEVKGSHDSFPHGAEETTIELVLNER